MLNVNQISFAYRTRRVLDSVSLDIVPGEIVGLIGANGAGKTTLLKVLATLLMHDCGSIRLNNINPLTRPIKYRAQLGYLSERTPLYNEMSVEEYLHHRIRLKGERTLRRRRRINEALENCALQDVRKEHIQLLSHGYRKRLSLAEALLTGPKLLLLDDLLAGLDRPQRKRCAETLVAISARSAILLTGHELEEMSAWCTRFIILHAGTIIANIRCGALDTKALLSLVDSAIGGHPIVAEESA